MQRHESLPQSPHPSGIRISLKDFFFISNLLSLLRLLLVPLIFLSLIRHHQSATFTFGGLAILSDALDGYFARRLNQQSDLGRILDPVADKTAIGAVIFGLILSNRDFPLWAFGIVLVRDVFILVGSALVFWKAKILATSNWWGKCTSFFLSTALILYIFELSAPIPFFVLCIGLVFALISTWRYTQRMVHLLRANLHSQKTAKRKSPC